MRMQARQRLVPSRRSANRSATQHRSATNNNARLPAQGRAMVPHPSAPRRRVRAATWSLLLVPCFLPLPRIEELEPGVVERKEEGEREEEREEEGKVERVVASRNRGEVCLEIGIRATQKHPRAPPPLQRYVVAGRSRNMGVCSTRTAHPQARRNPCLPRRKSTPVALPKSREIPQRCHPLHPRRTLEVWWRASWSGTPRAWRRTGARRKVH